MSCNVQSRLRMTTLYYYAQLNNFLVLGTGNKVEDFGVGFYTKYGDGCRLKSNGDWLNLKFVHFQNI